MSFKKAQKARQKPHRERAQLTDRESLGLLEKKKDYKLRAQNYHKKEIQLKHLRKKALMKNPDEFYFKMVGTKLQDGEHWCDEPRPEECMTKVQRQLIETQDINYVNWKLQIEKKKVEKLEENVQINNRNLVKNRHIRFVDKKEMGNSAEEIESWNVNDEHLKLSEELKQRHHRVAELQAVADKMSMQRLISHDANAADRKLVEKEGKSTAAIYQWKPIRKR